jgi:hypothetical protein
LTPAKGVIRKPMGPVASPLRELREALRTFKVSAKRLRILRIATDRDFNDWHPSQTQLSWSFAFGGWSWAWSQELWLGRSESRRFNVLRRDFGKKTWDKMSDSLSPSLQTVLDDMFDTYGETAVDRGTWIR